MNANRLSLWVDATLAGTLAVTLKAFTPAQNASFDILDFESTTTGTFGTVSLPALTGQLEWDTSKLYTNGIIRVVLPGDFNNSGGGRERGAGASDGDSCVRSGGDDVVAVARTLVAGD